MNERIFSDAKTNQNLFLRLAGDHQLPLRIRANRKEAAEYLQGNQTLEELVETRL